MINEFFFLKKKKERLNGTRKQMCNAFKNGFEKKTI